MRQVCRACVLRDLYVTHRISGICVKHEKQRVFAAKGVCGRLERLFFEGACQNVSVCCQGRGLRAFGAGMRYLRPPSGDIRQIANQKVA